MALDFSDCKFYGHALPEPFAKMDLEALLLQAKLLPKNTGQEGKTLQESWDVYRRKLRELRTNGGPVMVARRVLEPLAARLGYATFRQDEDVVTREGTESGGWVFESRDGQTVLRAWAVDVGADLDAPVRRGQAYRFGPVQVAQRVMQAKNERLALLTDGIELRILFRDPARRESHVAIELERAGGWRGARNVPDSFRLLLALASPAGVAFVPDLVEKARLAQARVTATLRAQAKAAVQAFIQEVLDDPRNVGFFSTYTDKQKLAQALYKDALVIVYRLLFILKLEASSDVDRSFSFSSVTLWRNTYSPSVALAPIVRKALDTGAETGEMIGGGLRALFRMFRDGFTWSEMKISRLGGMLFGENAAPILDDENLRWSERAAARLLDALLWTPRVSKEERQRVHYGPMDVEDLGRVYEALLELEPGLATEPMCRLRRQKLEVVVPKAQGEPYRTNVASSSDETEDEDEPEEDEDKPARGKTRVVWVEEIPAGAFYMRVGLGRKASGSYYTPHAFVRFLVQETLEPQIAERSPENDPKPVEILSLKVLDPAMGSGHFLVEACRYLGEELYKACWFCDRRAKEAEEAAEKSTGAERDKFLYSAMSWRKRVMDLPDPNDEMLAYLPSRVREGEEGGVSEAKAKALCRRLVAVHCLYGVDKNPLAVELAKLSLWLESYAEGLPLTFLDHRLLHRDSLSGSFFAKLGTYPQSETPVHDLFAWNIAERVTAAFSEAIKYVGELQSSIGKDAADIEHKAIVKANLDRALAPFLTLAAAWTGGVMLAERACDDDYRALIEAVAENGDWEQVVRGRPILAKMVKLGREAAVYELLFPEVFYPSGRLDNRVGFNAVVGNPPWDAIKFNTKEFLAAFDIAVLDAPTKRERDLVEKRVMQDRAVAELFSTYQGAFEEAKRANDKNYEHQKVIIDGDLAGRQLDAFRVFIERSWQLMAKDARLGLVVPSAFHVSAGAAGVRTMLLTENSIRSYYTFINTRRLFEISSGFRFGLLVCQKLPSEDRPISVAFDLTNPEILFSSIQEQSLLMSAEMIRKISPHMTFPSVGSSDDVATLSAVLKSGTTFSSWSSDAGFALKSTPTAIHMTHEAKRFEPLDSVFSRGVEPRRLSPETILSKHRCLVVHEGKTFHQYEDTWGERPRYCIPLDRIEGEDRWMRMVPQFKMAIRAIVGNAEEKGVACLLPPGYLVGNSALIEGDPDKRAYSVALLALATVNSTQFNWLLRLSSDLNINLFLMRPLPWPARLPKQFLAHSALRLSCNHEGYAPLWKEQLGEDTWREPTPKDSWPVLEGDDTRWGVRAAIDAVVADAYGLSREQYEHVLKSFSHKSYPKAPERCLAAFDELKRIGLEAFVKANDPYHDIPLNEQLPKPVIELQIPGGPAEGAAFKLEAQDAAPAKKRGARKKG